MAASVDNLDEQEDGSLKFEFGLRETGDPRSGYHIKNDPESPYQRSDVVQRLATLSVTCSCIDIVHGQWGGPDDTESRASLVVLLFRFDNQRSGSSRLLSAQAEFKFFDSEDRHRENPQVYDISFNGSYSLLPTKDVESLTRGITTGVSVGLAGGGIGPSLSGSVNYEKKFEREISDATSVMGNIYRLDTTVGPKNTALWRLSENSAKKTGIPVAMRVGILLKRSAACNKFYCTVKLKTKTELKTRMRELFGGTEADDPIYFDDSLRPTNKLMKYDLDNLGSFDVAQVEDVTFTTIRNNAIKEVG